MLELLVGLFVAAAGLLAWVAVRIVRQWRAPGPAASRERPRGPRIDAPEPGGGSRSQSDTVYPQADERSIPQQARAPSPSRRTGYGFEWNAQPPAPVAPPPPDAARPRVEAPPLPGAAPPPVQAPPRSGSAAPTPDRDAAAYERLLERQVIDAEERRRRREADAATRVTNPSRPPDPERADPRDTGDADEAAPRRFRLSLPQPAAPEPGDTPTGLAPRAAEPEASTEPYTEVTVFYGTNRSRAQPGEWYGSNRDVMHYGRCRVTVPTDRRIGSIPRPSIWTFFRERPEEHYILEGVEERRNKEEFTASLRAFIHARPGRHALVFVHGFNITFADAVYRTAQIAADLDFPGAPILFSWPSKGSLSPLGYTHDETQARWTLPDLRAFLELIAEQSGAETIHLLAHSMGNRVLTDALAQMAAAAARRSRGLFNELVLTAPDIDADTFVRDVAPAIVTTSRRITLYASSNDKALAFSKSVHGYARAGDSGEGIVLVEGIDTIDVSSVDTDLIGHFYYGDNRSVLSDLFHLMQGQPAGSRFGLRPRRKNARPYWVFQP
jgi:esterase/lipase superfamily enzyme